MAGMFFRRLLVDKRAETISINTSADTQSDLNTTIITGGPNTSSSEDLNNLIINYSNQQTTSSSDTLVIVITKKPFSGASITPSISWRIPTITTDELPTATTTQEFSNSRIRGSINPETYSVSSAWEVLPTSSLSQRSVSTNFSFTPIKSKSGPWNSRSYTLSTTSPHSSTALTTTSLTTSTSTPTSTPTTTTTTPSGSAVGETSTRSKDKTTTITEYYEDLTYTQVYVITNPLTTITTSLLATTTFMADSLSETYEIEPPAITTDAASFKALYDVDPTASSRNFSKQAKAGVAVGVVFGFLFLVLALFFWLRKKKPGWLNRIYGAKSFDSDESNITNDEEIGFHHSLGIVDEADPFSLNYQMEKTSTAPRESFETPEMQSNPIFTKSTSDTNIDRYSKNGEESLFDMKSTLTSLGSQYDNKHSSISIPPKIPPPRKNIESVDDQLLGLGSMIRDSSIGSSSDIGLGISKSNKFGNEEMSSDILHTNNTPSLLDPLGKTLGGPPNIREVLRGTPPPARDRTMGVVYESDNEQDEPRPLMSIPFKHGRHNSDDYDFRSLQLEIPSYKRKSIPSPLKITRDSSVESFMSPPSPFSDSWQRARSGSVPKRYESLSESVMNLKQTLKTEDDSNKDIFIANEDTKRISKPEIPPPRKNVVTDIITVKRNSSGSSLSDIED